MVTAVLGESGTGLQGSAAVRAQVSDAMTGLADATRTTRPWRRDLACACTWALGRRDGGGATDILLEAARSPNPSMSR